MDKIIIIDFGSQFTQLIARGVRELNVYSEIIPYSTDLNIDYQGVRGVIFSGSPCSVNGIDPPTIDVKSIADQVPILAICYGAQMVAKYVGGRVENSDKREYGKATLNIDVQHTIFLDIPQESQVWMSHSDSVKTLPEDATILATTLDIPIAAYNIDRFKNSIIALQFHPEVFHTIYGLKILSNFIHKIAQLNSDWTPHNFVEYEIEQLRKTVGEDKVIIGLSGGVDSTVAALLLKEAIGENLLGIFINNGLLRKDEYNQVLTSYQQMGLHVKGVDASEYFYAKLQDITDPETKRKHIGNAFIEVFEKEAKNIDNIKWLAQGTIYPDVIESANIPGLAQTIKSHHNVGGLPDKLNLKIIEPLRMLFKDEVRKVGKELNCPPQILNRHPFPGPGLAIRIIGEITSEQIRINQEADHIFITELHKHNYYDKVWQAGCILLPIKSVGVMGDERSYEQTIVLRCVNARDGMTATWSHIPYELLGYISNRIINEVRGVNRVVYDISSKPPATIEWE